MVIKNVRTLIDELKKLGNEYGFLELELANLIQAIANDTEELTDEQIRQCWKVIDFPDDTIEYGIKCDLYDILNK